MKRLRTVRAAAPTPEGREIGIPLGQQVRRYILGRVESGEWAEGDRIPSEPRLSEQFGISRMTAHIALRDLAAEGYLVRRQGAGTFVAPRRSQSTFMKLRNIKEEIEERGNAHSVDVRLLEAVDSDLGLATELGVPPGSKLFHSVIVHFENGEPIQIEDRYVNPLFSPNYLKQDFNEITPNEHLTSIGPVDEAEHIIQAIPADRATSEALDIKEGDPVLLLRRRTWSGGIVATSARLRHPGARFSLAGRLTASR